VRILMASTLLIASSLTAAAQVPDEDTKIRALKRAYELNGSMVRWGSINVSNDPVVVNPPADHNAAADAPVPRTLRQPKSISRVRR
jgi:hypothetical protein